MTASARQERRRRRKDQASAGDPEVLKLLKWRQEQFEDVLVVIDDERKRKRMARKLASDSKATWHEAKKLLDDGCPPELIVEILT